MILNLRFLENPVSYWPAERLLASLNGLVNKFVISGFKGTQYVLNLFDKLYKSNVCGNYVSVLPTPAVKVTEVTSDGVKYIRW
jgi:hypothetical protein